MHITQPQRVWSPTTSRCACRSSTQPITGLRVVFHPDAEHARRRLGLRARCRRLGTKDKPTKRRSKGTFVLTAFSASADSVPGDQVNLNRLLAVSPRHRQLAGDAECRPEGVLDTRNENGWSPDAIARRARAHHRHLRQAGRHGSRRRSDGPSSTSATAPARRRPLRIPRHDRHRRRQRSAAGHHRDRRRRPPTSGRRSRRSATAQTTSPTTPTPRSRCASPGEPRRAAARRSPKSSRRW